MQISLSSIPWPIDEPWKVLAVLGAVVIIYGLIKLPEILDEQDRNVEKGKGG